MAWATGSTVVQLPGMGRTGVWSQVGERVVRHQDFDDGRVTCEMPLVSKWGCPGAGRCMSLELRREVRLEASPLKASVQGCFKAMGSPGTQDSSV